MPHQTLDGVTNPHQAPPKPSRIRSFLATDLNAQQTSPRPYFAGPNGRKGRMLLGAGFEPPANQYTGQTYRTMKDAKFNRAQRHQHLLQQREQRYQHYGAHHVNAPPSTSIVTVDRTAPQRYHFSPRERKQHLTSLLAKNEGNGGRRHGYGSPRSQNIGPSSWTYKDRTLARYRQYKPGYDQPNPTRPMARTEAQMLHRNNATYVPTPLSGPGGGRREEANVYPPVQQNYGYGTHQYQDRMMLARTRTMLPIPANPATRSTPGSMPTTMDSIDAIASPRPQKQRTAANQRVPLLGVKEVSGRVEFMNRQKYVAPLQRVPFSNGPKVCSNGPKPALLVKRPAPAEYHRVERYGASLRHGRKDRVGFWQSPLTKREK